MDKRSLFFIVATAVVFFILHQWFESNSEKLRITTLETATTTVIFSGKGKAVPLTEEEMEKLHIVKLYTDIDFHDFLTFAIEGQENYITLASEDLSYPSEAYVKKTIANISFPSRVQLRVKPNLIGDPVLYSVSPSIKFKTPWLPMAGEYSVSLIYFDKRIPYKIKGQYFGFPKLVLEQAPPQNGITLFNFKGDIIPSAIYHSDTKTVDYLDWIKSFENYSVLVYPEDTLAKERTGIKFYVLENEYMQLVFSNFNGALAEINLPFWSKKNQSSMVRRIEFDRIIQANYPNNANFPQFPYFVPNGNKGTKLMQPQRGGYYPLLRRNIIGLSDDTTSWINPHFYSLNLFNSIDVPQVLVYKLKRFEKNLIEFEYAAEKGRITKTISFPSDVKDAPYVFDLTIKIEGEIPPPLFLQVGFPEVELIFGSFSPTLKYRTLRKDKPAVEEIELPETLVFFKDIKADWYSSGNGYFGIIIDPLNRKPNLEMIPISGEMVPSRITLIGSQFQLYPASTYPGYGMHIPVETSGMTTFRVFAGPYAKAILNRVDQTFTDPITGYSPDYLHAQSYHGWFEPLSQPFSNMLFSIIDFFHSVTRSWGISIILLSIAVFLILYPINNWSMKSTAKLQKLSPKIQEIYEKYKKDPKRVKIEANSLFTREDVNPYRGYFSILIQLPFLFGMFYVLKTTYRLRGASFIPGWIEDLSAPDVLFRLDYPIPFIGMSFHLLPLLVAVVMYFEQKLTVTAATVKAFPTRQKQQRIMGILMVIIFTILFYQFPSGLNLYWICTMLLAILQQMWVNKRLGVPSRKRG